MRIKPHARIALMAAAICCAHSTSAGSGDPYGNDPRAVAPIISKHLPQGWVCLADYTHIIISYSNKVGMLNPISLPSNNSGQLLKTYGFWSEYMIVLRFVPKYSEADLDLLRKTRAEKANAAAKNPGKDGKMAAWDALLVERQYPLPTFYDPEHSIFLERTDQDPLIVVAPEAFIRELRIVFQTLQSTFSLYDIKSQPAAGLYLHEHGRQRQR